MKIKVLPSAVAAATLILLPFTVAAEAESSEDKPAAPRKAARQQQQAERLARFDTSGDGKLAETERRKARETWQAERSRREPARPGPALGGRMRERAKQFDQDGDGKLNAEERAALEAAHRAQLEKRPGVMKRFDRDGDGSLSDGEWEKARQEMRRRMGPKKAPPTGLDSSEVSEPSNQFIALSGRPSRAPLRLVLTAEENVSLPGRV